MIGKRIVFIGAPGVGKGTFANLLCKRWNIPHICVGDLLREDVAKSQLTVNTCLQDHADSLNSRVDKIAQYMKQGVLIPDSTICEYVSAKLNSREHPSAGYILDGFPRNKTQVKYLLDNNLVDIVVHITLERWVSIEKILGRRRCTTCGNDFNVASVMSGGYNMPAILPTDKGYKCPQILVGEKCKPVFSIRSDDNVDSLNARLESYDVETTAAVESFKEAVAENKAITVHHFAVKKGIQDTDALAEVIMS